MATMYYMCKYVLIVLCTITKPKTIQASGKDSRLSP